MIVSKAACIFNEGKLLKMMKNKRHPWKLIPAIIMMAGIFIHSSMNGDMSTLESDALIRILGIPLTDIAVVVVRKCAHLMEYAALGASMYLLTDDAVSGLQRTVLRSKTDAMRSERTDL